MRVLVVNSDGESIKALLYSYDSAGAEIGQEQIPVGGTEIMQIPDAVLFKFVADGFQDATINDLYNYNSLTLEMIPKFRWLVPVALTAGGLIAAIKIFKLKI